MQKNWHLYLAIFLGVALTCCLARTGRQADVKAPTDERLTAVFDTAADSVIVTLPDGKQLRLPRCLSVSRARYTDGSETLREHHGGGSCWIGDKLVYRSKEKV
jgi:hypothetical protein